MDQSKKHQERNRLVVIVLFFMGLLFMAIFAVGIGWASADRGGFQTDWLQDIAGPVLTLSGLALVAWSVAIQYTLGKGTPAPKVATLKLVTTGPYAWTRNPMTLGALLMYLGIGIWIGSGVVIALTVIIFSGLLTFIYVHETKELSERFGDEYLEYKKRTPFLLPCLRRRM